MIFVDTSAWFARTVAADPFHKAAIEWTRSNLDLLITTDYVIDETLTLLKARGHYDGALAFGQSMFEEPLVHVHFLTPDDVFAAWRVFRNYRDKAWSFTDATSKIVIERLGIRQAFAFDEHFKQFGAIEVVPA
jgi:hypothetical protein